MLDLIKNNITSALVLVLGMYVSLQVLETKFDYQEVRAQERYKILVTIKDTVLSNTLQLNDLANSYTNLDDRVKRVERYVPGDLVAIEKDVIALQKDFAMMNYMLKAPQKNTESL